MYDGLAEHNKIELQDFVDVVLASGYAAAMYDPDLVGWRKPTRDRDELLSALGEADSDEVELYRDGFRVGWFWLIYGNGPGELIADHTANDVCDGIYNIWAKKAGAE